MSKKKSKPDTVPLIQSHNAELIGSRFLVKSSVMDNGVHPMSVMIAVVDNLENGFTIKFFSKMDDAASLLKLLKSAS